MCGICGFFGRSDISKKTLSAMIDTMTHRGPDDSGVFVGHTSLGMFVGLAHRRLSIIDLSSQGHQPMESCDGKQVLVFNGEIYNFESLKKHLTCYPYRSNSDTEVILAAYRKWGLNCVDHFNGMFAIALLDRDKEELIIYRDRIGKKPLYYFWDGKDLVFASTLRPIMEWLGDRKEINNEVIGRYLLHRYISAPDTILKNIYKLDSGCRLVCNSEGIRIEKYWDVSQIYHSFDGDRISDFSEVCDIVKNRVRDAVKLRLRSDVPLGAFLSGGIDSTLVSAMAQSELGTQKLKTFTIGFENEAFNEAEYAVDIASYLGTDHKVLYCGESELMSMIEGMPNYFDEPFADDSQIPFMLVSQLAASDVKVVLSGDGGDELFCGYDLYRELEKVQKLDGIGRIVDVVGRLLHIENYFPLKVRMIAQNRDANSKTQYRTAIYSDYILSMLPEGNNADLYYGVEGKYKENSWLRRRMLLDMEKSLPEDMLTKVDRGSMKYSIESRCPLLDKDVMEAALRVDTGLLTHGGESKAILKKLLDEYVPRSLMDRPKRGFGAPIDKWLRGPLKDRLILYSDASFLKRQGLFKPECTSRFVRDYVKNGDGDPGSGRHFSFIIWAFFCFQQWYERYFIT